MNFATDILNTETIPHLICNTCNGWQVLDEASFVRIVDGIEVTVQNLPILFCSTCELVRLPERSKTAILHHVADAKRAGNASVILTRKPEAKLERFEYCEKVEFIYDPTDYHYLPGLYCGDGFLTPVFFNKTVLLKYLNHPEYVVELGSDTYGTIRRNGEHILPFGINRRGKVIMWLGDLDHMPEPEQYYLRSENVPSDHDIGSEFYLGQIEAVFTDYSKERYLFDVRSRFGAKCLADYGLKANVYDMEVFDLMPEVVRPVAWGDKEVRSVVEALNKIIIESLNSDGLKKSIVALKPADDVKSLGGMKLFQKWLGLTYPAIDAAAALCPFFVLYDFRIVVAHLVPGETAEKKLAYCYERMELAEGARSYETLYDELIAGLTRSYELFLEAPKAIA